MRPSLRLAGLCAGVLTFCLASAARAEFSLQLLNNDTGDGFQISENPSGSKFSLSILGKTLSAGDVTWTAGSGHIHATATIDNYTFDVDALSNRTTAPTPHLARVSFNAT